MKEFLRQVAEHWLAAGDIENRCFIFPNRRSLAFFRKYLSEAVRDRGGKPLRVPALYTVNDFFYKAVGAYPSGKVRLLLTLYGCYGKLNPKAEPLDDFIFWGDILLSDFDDVDKYLVDPGRLFTNVSDLRGIQDSYEYLTEGQRNAIDRFLGHFRSGEKLTVDMSSESSGVKAGFLQIWNILLPLYRDFNEALDAAGMSYEGKVYRSLAERLDQESVADVLDVAFPNVDGYVFVGLNALNECEKKLMRRMRDARLASFCWDWSEGWISDRRNKSTVFMLDNLSDFPQAFSLEKCSSAGPEVNVLSVPSSVGQAKQLPAIFERIASEDACGDVAGLGLDTAVVLPDENLLIPVLNSIPEEISAINVTMGYPMSSSSLYSLISEVSAMQMHLRQKDGQWFYYYKQVYAIFSNSVFKSSISAEAAACIPSIKSAAQYYIPQQSFPDDPVFNAIFRPVVKDTKIADASSCRLTGEYLKSVVRTVALKLKKVPEMASELDFARDCYQSLNGLVSEDIPVLPATYFRIVSQVLLQSSVPFNGEPLHGLQIMGPLETRTLDFRNLVILSANEGIFPRRSVSSSFIPPELRKGFGLPTYEYQDAVWAYYFYRMLLRAERVWMLCDSRTEGLKSGEESRYIKQLELHLGAKVNRYVAKAPASVGEMVTEIEKTPEDVLAVRCTALSATALQNYLYCQAKFYYHTVKKLRPDDEVSESLDAGMIGNVFHKTMQNLYSTESGHVSKEYIKSWQSRPDDIRAMIRSLIKDELHTFEVSGRNLVFENVVLEYVMKVLERDLEHLAKSGMDDFIVYGVELPRNWEYDGFRFYGIIDRMDSFRRDEVRVVDYKTGKVEEADINISDENAGVVVEKLFGESNQGRPKIALQLFLYDMFVQDMKEVSGKSLVNSIYSPSRLFVSEVECVPSSPKFISLMKERLSALLKEISDVEIPFRRTEDVSTCEYCDFKNICGR